MSLITIEKLEIKIDLENVSKDAKTILHKLNTLIDLTMASKAEFQQALADVTSALDNIAADITRLTDQLANGGLSDADEQEIFTQLRAVADRAKSIADTTIDPEVPPTETPTA
jgi:ABC-type transporter Mla subunit MlaD